MYNFVDYLPLNRLFLSSKVFSDMMFIDISDINKDVRKNI